MFQVRTMPGWGTGATDLPAISDSGDAIAFTTADFLTGAGHVGVAYDDVRHTPRQQTSLISIDPTGRQDLCAARDPLISGDGRYVGSDLCTTDSMVQAPPGTYPTSLVIKDRATGELERIGVPHELAPTIGSVSGVSPAFLDRDGSHVVFVCAISSAVPWAACLQDRRTGDTTVVSRRTDGQMVGGFDLPASISDDGHLVAFIAHVADV